MTLRHVVILGLLTVTTLCAGAAGLLDGIPRVSPVLEGYREDTIRPRLAAAPLHNVEGLWQMAGEGSLLAVEQTRPGVYALVLVRAADRALRHGTVMGWLTPGADTGSFEMRLYTSRRDDGTLLDSPSRFAGQLSADGNSLVISPVGRKFRFNWWRLLLPYAYRGLVTPLENSDKGLHGLRRVYPTPLPTDKPRYL